MIQLGEQIKKLRQRDGLSQEELSNRLFISLQAISKWEKGESIPDLDHIIQLSEIFDVSLDYLILAKENLRISRR
ncbi:helix-turn-helix domain-containing protein [Streptococcus fryi]